MMARPNGPTATTDGIDWREARYLARLVQMLVSSRADKAEFKRDLEYLASAAEALRRGRRASRPTGPDGAGDPDSPGRAEAETESAVLALWRRRPSIVREETAPRRDDVTTVETPGLARSGAGAVDDAELERAVAEIERAAAALRVDEAGSIAAGGGAPRRRPVRVWLQIAGLWISIVAATAAMVVGLVVLMR
jgi:hypothetical protein